MKKITLISVIALSLLSCKKGEEVNPNVDQPYAINEPCIKEDAKTIIGYSTINYTYRNYLSKDEGEDTGYYLTVSSTGYIAPSDTATIFTESTKGVHQVTVYHYKNTESVTFYVSDVDGSELTTTVDVDLGDSIDWEVIE
tara:strand:+ start:1179 stop:1598 length:420 start_codon:yes stop_codon:yes gene_type:complete